jgi:hypothetical protein
MNSPLLAAWTPPENPDPDKIFDEAISDTKAGRYVDALAKHVWFHENALKIAPAFYGVRLSFALVDWVELGKAYPPALEKLKGIRDQTADRIRNTVGNHSTAQTDRDRLRDAFHDVVSINKYLKETGKSKDLFFWLDSHKPRLANYLFDLAEPALIEAKEYRLCGRYLEADDSFQRFRDIYRRDIESPQDREFAGKSFVNETTTLVALLVLNDRKADADRIAAEALKERNDAPFKAELEKAKQGAVPAPWP